MRELHLHVNGLELDLARTQKDLEELGFEYNPSTIYVAGDPYPLHLFTARIRDETKQRDLWNGALRIIRSDSRFNGYIEAETTSDRLCFEADEKAFDPTGMFPITSYSFIPKRKQGDVHVYRGLGTPRDELDSLLLLHGFYEVQTTRSRIFTAETETPVDAFEIYSALKRYFAKAGRIMKLDAEVVRDLQTVPDTFQLRPVIRLGGTPVEFQSASSRGRAIYSFKNFL